MIISTPSVPITLYVVMRTYCPWSTYPHQWTYHMWRQWNDKAYVLSRKARVRQRFDLLTARGRSPLNPSLSRTNDLWSRHCLGTVTSDPSLPGLVTSGLWPPPYPGRWLFSFTGRTTRVVLDSWVESDSTSWVRVWRVCNWLSWVWRVWFKWVNKNSIVRCFILSLTPNVCIGNSQCFRGYRRKTIFTTMRPGNVPRSWFGIASGMPAYSLLFKFGPDCKHLFENSTGFAERITWKTG